MGGPAKLAPGQRRALARLKGLKALRGFYLAGGSAVAVHLQHRRSDDLDLFSARRDVDLETIAEEIASLPGVTIVSATDTAIKLRLGNVPVDVVRYPYPLLRQASPGPEGFPVATLLDLAVMKLAAIASRGIHRDFWDLHEILTRSQITLDRALDAYIKRFGVKKSDVYHVLEALTYFHDAEQEPRPRGLTAKRWGAIQSYFLAKAPQALRKRL
jgi:hypothetical protein